MILNAVLLHLFVFCFPNKTLSLLSEATMEGATAASPDDWCRKTLDVKAEQRASRISTPRRHGKNSSHLG